MDHMSTEAVVVLISHPHMVDVERMFLMLVLTNDKSIMNISTCAVIAKQPVCMCPSLSLLIFKKQMLCTSNV